MIGALVVAVVLWAHAQAHAELRDCPMGVKAWSADECRRISVGEHLERWAR